jgi:hypothetical protein
MAAAASSASSGAASVSRIRAELVSSRELDDMPLELLELIASYADFCERRCAVPVGAPSAAPPFACAPAAPRQRASGLRATPSRTGSPIVPRIELPDNKEAASLSADGRTVTFQRAGEVRAVAQRNDPAP